jgi:hypothetical protein
MNLQRPATALAETLSGALAMVAVVPVIARINVWPHGRRGMGPR